MQWVSLDQKPAYFNNAGHTGTYAEQGKWVTVQEDHSATRERYSILTVIPWRGDYATRTRRGSQPSADGLQINPPKFAVLFKGQKGGRIAAQLKREFSCDFLLPQVQKYGSYRSEDMVEALDWLLPTANDTSESIVVMLDWYSGHRTEEVLDLILKKGHVVLFHGGGTTPYTQVNDTHFHGLIQSLLIRIENHWAHSQREDQQKTGQYRTPKSTRVDILCMCKKIWEMVWADDQMAEAAYRQTGPAMPLDGDLDKFDISTELARVWVEIDPGDTPGSIGTKIRDDAIAMINDGWGTRWTCWEDAYSVIDEHDGEDSPDEEGMEGMRYAPYDDDDDHPDDSSDPDEEGGDEDEPDDEGGDDDNGPNGDERDASDDDKCVIIKDDDDDEVN